MGAWDVQTILCQTIDSVVCKISLWYLEHGTIIALLILVEFEFVMIKQNGLANRTHLNRMSSVLIPMISCCKTYYYKFHIL